MPNSHKTSLDVPAQPRHPGESGGKKDDEQMGRIAFAVHEMCQPLMALQCRLEIGRMIGTADGYAEAVREGLSECDRLLVSVEVLRAEVLRGMRGCAP